MSDNINNSISQPLLTPEGYLNQACVNELEHAITNLPKTHQRLNNDPEWNEKHWVFVKDITSYLAKWAISQSPYHYPEGLDRVIKYLHECLKIQANENEMMEVSLCDVNKLLYEILYEQGVTDFNNWNISKNTTPNIAYTSRFDNKSNPDNDFIDLDALLHNVCLSLRLDFRANKAFDDRFKKEHGYLPWENNEE
jgi:hypothetical protein